MVEPAIPDESRRTKSRRGTALFAIAAALGMFVFVPERTEAQWREDLFTGPDELERSLAAMALGSGPTPWSIEVALDLVEATGDVNPAVHTVARHWLRERATEMAPVLMGIAFGDHAGPSPYLAEAAIRNEASNALSSTRNRDAVRAMIAIASSPAHPRRELAIGTLSRNAATCALDVLGEMIDDDPSFAVASVGGVILAAMTKPRLEARGELLRIAKARPKFAQLVVLAASRLAVDPTPQTFAMIEDLAEVLGDLHLELLSRLIAVVESPSAPPLSRAIAESLGPKSAEVLADFLRSPDPNQGRRARVAIGLLNRPESRFAALRRIDLDEAENDALVMAMIGRVEARDVDELIRLCREPVIASRRVALLAIERLPATIDRFRPDLEKLAHDVDPRVRAHARSILAADGDSR